MNIIDQVKSILNEYDLDTITITKDDGVHNIYMTIGQTELDEEGNDE